MVFFPCVYSIVVTHQNGHFSIAFPMFHACFTWLGIILPSPQCFHRCNQFSKRSTQICHCFPILFPLFYVIFPHLFIVYPKFQTYGMKIALLTFFLAKTQLLRITCVSSPLGYHNKLEEWNNIRKQGFEKFKIDGQKYYLSVFEVRSIDEDHKNALNLERIRYAVHLAKKYHHGTFRVFCHGVTRFLQCV